MILGRVVDEIVSPQNSYMKSSLSVPQSSITLFENTTIYTNIRETYKLTISRYAHQPIRNEHSN